MGDGFEDAFDVLIDLVHPEAQHVKAHLAQPVISPGVVEVLIAVLVAIDFDHQPCLQAGEVGEGMDANLSAARGGCKPGC